MNNGVAENISFKFGFSKKPKQNNTFSAIPLLFVQSYRVMYTMYHHKRIKVYVIDLKIKRTKVHT